MTSTPQPRRRFAGAAFAGLFATLLVLAGLGAGVASAEAKTFDPNRVITNANMRASGSMSAAQIQAFLSKKPGPLKRMSFPRQSDGSIAPASVLIYEGCQTWQISPKVMLTMLQKEQSLMTRTSLGANTLARAIGAGCPNRYTNRYPGFGNQMWNGARMLDGYGEGKTTPYIALWRPGTRYKDLYAKPVQYVTPVNIATFKLYVYNPSVGAKKPYGDLSRQACSGNANFWKIYWSYFGDPLGGTPDVTSSASAAGEPVSSIRLDRPYARTPYGGSVSLSGHLDASPTAAAAGAKVRLESLGSAGWIAEAGSEQAVGRDGSFRFGLSRTSMRRVRVTFSGNETLPQAASGLFVSDIASVLSTPTQMGTVTAGAPLKIRGTLKPAYSTLVSVTLYQVVSGTTRAWKTFSVRSSAAGVWSLQVKLAKGAWKVRATQVDARYARGISPWGRVTSK
jgi:hypothetical protein